MQLSKFSLALVVFFSALTSFVPSASAGGLFLTDRGARALGRGFAFVAGVDSAEAIWYNPAALTIAGQSLVLDINLNWFRGDYTRVDSGGNTLATVDANAVPLPFPTIAYSHPIGDFAVGGALTVPPGVLLRWPNGVTPSGDACEDPSLDGANGCGAAPQRYSLYTLDGTFFLQASVGAAWRPHEYFSVGLSFDMFMGRFQGESALTGCDGLVCSQPENPRHDGRARFSGPIVTPGFSIGVLFHHPVVRVGLSANAFPLAVDTNIELSVRLPSSPIFDGASIDGNTASFQLPLPFTLRAGVEVRPTNRLAIEAAVVYEHWSSQDAITITPDNIFIRDAVAIGDYQVGSIAIPRNMRNVFSARLGGTFQAHDQVSISAGFGYENSSFDDEYLSAMTLDSDKFLVSIGAAIRLSDSLTLDVSYGHLFMVDRVVENSAVTQPNAIRPPRASGVPPTQGGQVYIGNGNYNMEADVFGIGLRWTPGAEASESGDAGVDGTRPVGETGSRFREGGAESARQGVEASEASADAADASAESPEADESDEAESDDWLSDYR